jgi:hypothetical protein
MTSYRGSRNVNDSRFRIREVSDVPVVGKRKVSVGRVAETCKLTELYRICLGLGIAAPFSTPVTREVAEVALALKLIDSERRTDEQVQRIYDLSRLSREDLLATMERFFELHDLLDA